MADIVLRDRIGNPVEYPGVERIKLNTTGGETVEFVDPALIPESVEKTIDPDFSGGKIVETPEAGTMFSKVTVNKPATLDPKYIAEGVNIAGIIGTLAAGGNTKFEFGTFDYSGSKITIDHGLGVEPDLLIILSNSNGHLNGRWTFYFRLSDAMIEKTGAYYGVRMFGWQGSYGDTLKQFYGANNDAASPYITVNETSFSVDKNYLVNIPHLWLAIGGLT